ncbi:TRAP transporter large permease subunit [Pikeienuella piscinae]|uniref:TRAP transporter large permease subunit n=1 Tax=Pikeienuella piscinae TaxID=2748098 RepID=A0A7L5BTI7_9RHOB|nr:TRAP transporter large permease subunit [Pikeienuella piscinae]QIE54905.1 TRAP transporter large permease subunit [Pikeienuella piscinae]
MTAQNVDGPTFLVFAKAVRSHSPSSENEGFGDAKDSNLAFSTFSATGHQACCPGSRARHRPCASHLGPIRSNSGGRPAGFNPGAFPNFDSALSGAAAHAFGAAGAFLIAALVFYSLDLRRTFAILASSVRVSGAILLIVGSARIFGDHLNLIRLPETLTQLLVATELPGWTLLILVMIALVLLDMLVDAVSLIVVTTPILLPLFVAPGYDPLWFGIILVMNLEVAVVTPPVGLNLYSPRRALTAQTLTGVTYPPPSYTAISYGSNGFVERLHASDAVNADFRDSGKLLKADEQFPALRDGAIQFMFHMMSYVTRTPPILGSTGIPGVVNELHAHPDRLAMGSPLFDLINEELAKQGLYMLSMGGGALGRNMSGPPRPRRSAPSPISKARRSASSASRRRA